MRVQYVLREDQVDWLRTQEGRSASDLVREAVDLLISREGSPSINGVDHESQMRQEAGGVAGG